MNIRTALSTRPSGLLVALILGSALVLTGCQGGEPVTEPTSTSATPTVTATPTPTPTAAYKPADASGKAQNVPVPVKPALADENSKEGLEAFTKYWFELLSYGYETGDTDAWEQLFRPNCKFCLQLQSAIADSYVDGGWVVGGQISAVSAEAKTFSGDVAEEQVTLQVIHKPIHYHNADGSQAFDSTQGSNTGAVIVCSFVDGQWIVDDLGLIR